MKYASFGSRWNNESKFLETKCSAFYGCAALNSHSLSQGNMPATITAVSVDLTSTEKVREH